MKARQIRQFAMLRRVQQLLDEFGTRLGALSSSAVRKEFDTLVAEMGANEATQATSTLNAKSMTAVQASLRDALVTHHMRPIATIAAAHLREVPGFAALQPPRKDIKVALLIDDAIAMAEAARPYQQVFVESGCPEDFADALVAAAEAVRGSIDARARSIMSRAGARAGLQATAARARLILRVLDAQVRSALVSDPKALAAWKSAKRIGKGKVVPMEPTTPASAAPSASTTTQAIAA